MRHFIMSILALAVFYGITASSYAGNPTNASEVGNVTGIVICEDKDDDIPVDELTIAVTSDDCSCELEECTLEDIDCGEDDPCSVCLGSLKRLGMSITKSNAFFGTDQEETAPESEFLYYNLLEGNAGPFLERLGECPCDVICP